MSRTRSISRLHAHLTPSLVVSIVALIASLGGTVYAAGKVGKINGKAVKVKSLPGNRVVPHSITANRLKAGLLPSPTNPVTGAQINELSLGPVPTAIFAETADRAQTALDAQTALNAVNAISATKINGYSAGCLPGTRLFAGSCWEASTSGVSMTAPNAAVECAKKGGVLPDAFELVAFSLEPGVTLDSEGEWSNDIVSFSGANVYAAATVTAGAPPVIGSAAYNGGGVSAARHFRCVLPLVK
jgi:hypothetical protein